MQNPAPAPRLPIEPESRPFYQPPSRLGCSGVALVSLVTVAAFLLLFAVLVPQFLDRVREISWPQALGLAPRPTATTALAAATILPASPIATVAPADSPVPTPLPPTATPEPEYVAIGNSAGDNVALRNAPRSDADKLVALRPRTVLLVVGADVTTDGKLWRNVRTTTGDAASGWVMAQYLVPSGPP
jgi:hypothetical protein